MFKNKANICFVLLLKLRHSLSLCSWLLFAPTSQGLSFTTVFPRGALLKLWRAPESLGVLVKHAYSWASHHTC